MACRGHQWSVGFRRPLETRGTIVNVAGRSPDHPVGCRPNPRALFTNAAVAPRGQVTARNDPGESPHHPVAPRPDPRALSGPVISFEPPTRRWLTGAIYVHECRGGAQRPGDRHKRSGGGPLTTLWGPGPTPGPFVAP